MKHTPEQLAGMSDFELNKALNDALGFKLVVDCDNGAGEAAIFTNINGEHGAWVDYCTDWAVTGPLMTKNKISLIDETLSGRRGYMAAAQVKMLDDFGISCDKCAFSATSEPLRAVVECLILVLQEGE